MAGAESDRFSISEISAGTFGGFFFAIAARVLDATPCCGGVRAIFDLGRVPFGLLLVGFVLVQTIRVVANLFRGRWRTALSSLVSVVAIPIVFVGLIVPMIFDPDYWWMRSRAADLERDIVAKTQKGEFPFSIITRRDVSGGFVTAPIVLKTIVYDGSDQISLPYQRRSEVWRAAAEKAFRDGCPDKKSDGRRMFGHFYVVYDGC